MSIIHIKFLKQNIFNNICNSNKNENIDFDGYMNNLIL